jgi:hypothetical protein
MSTFDFKNSPLGGARIETPAFHPMADGSPDMAQWRPGSEDPANAGFYTVRDRQGPRSLARRVLFSGHFWMTDTPVAAWRAPSQPEATRQASRAISQLASKLVENGAAPARAPARTFNELALVPIDGPDPSQPGDMWSGAVHEHAAELRALKHAAGLELRVEVVRFLKPAPGAQGVVAGRVLSVSENYSAQHAGADKIVVHENKNLPRPLSPGESVTLEYRGDKVYVYDGIAHDINISAPWMPQEQQAHLRRVMFDALSTMSKPQSDDERLREAMHYALDSTARHFGAQTSMLRRADIQLVVNEMAAVVKGDEPERVAEGKASSVGAPTQRSRGMRA